MAAGSRCFPRTNHCAPIASRGSTAGHDPIGLAACVLWLTAGCGPSGPGPIEATTFAAIGETADGVDRDCRTVSADDCEQAVNAIVNQLPYGPDAAATPRDGVPLHNA